MNVVFFGTPAFSVPTLNDLLTQPDIKIQAVVCQPDRPSGRGHHLQPPPIKQVATAHQIPVFQPKSIRKDEALLTTLRQLSPDFFVTIAFGQILSQSVLDIPRLGTINVHASLLPALRGANPIQWAILNGHTETGLTTMLTDIGVDTGPMFLKMTTSIQADETAEQLSERLSFAGGSLLIETLRGVLTGRLKSLPQDDALATHAPKLSKTDALINWQESAEHLMLKIRGQMPWPGTHTIWQDQVLKMTQARIATNELSLPPGCFKVGVKHRLFIGTGTRTLELLMVQPPGKKIMTSSDWLRGLPANLLPG